MRYFYVCPSCLAKVEYDDDLKDEYLQCTCENVWQFSDNNVMSEYDYKNKKTMIETQYKIELNHLVRCTFCDGEHDYKLSMINKWVDCNHCNEKFQCTAKNVYFK